MKKLRDTEKTKRKLIDMARDLEFENGGFGWADTVDITDPDELFYGVKPAESFRAMFFGSIEEGVSYSDALVRWNSLGNLEIISSRTLENEAWDERDGILDSYEEEFGADRLDEALAEMDTDGE